MSMSYLKSKYRITMYMTQESPLPSATAFLGCCAMAYSGFSPSMSASDSIMGFARVGRRTAPTVLTSDKNLCSIKLFFNEVSLY